MESTSDWDMMMPAMEEWEAVGFGTSTGVTVVPVCPGLMDVLNNGLTDLTPGTGSSNTRYPWT